MDSTAIGLYIYLGSSDKIIEWLEKEEGVTTSKQALQYLKPHVKSNIIDVVSLPNGGGSLGGTASCVKNVVEYFENKEKNL